MFYVTRLLVELIAPLNIILFLLAATFVLLLFRRAKVALACVGGTLFLLLFCGYGFITKQEIGRLEQTYPALSGTRLNDFNGKHIQYIVVLGSAHVSDQRLPVTSQIGGSSLYRLAEGIRLLNLLPGTKLVLSGGVGYDPVPNADVVSHVAESLGVSPERIVTESRPRDTVQEAQLLKPLLEGQDFILVTSALHMPRAIEIFRSIGLRPIAAPTDYLMKQQAVAPPGDIFPSVANIDLSRRIMYEWIGSIWSRIKMRSKKDSD